MKIRIPLVTATHETKYGVDSYVRVVKKDETVEDIVEKLKVECEYHESEDALDCNEHFDCDIDEIIIDTDDFEEVK